MNAKQRVLIMGLGLHGGGVGASNYFSSTGAKVTVTDLKSEDELKSSIKALKNTRRLRFVFGRHELSDFENVDLIVKNPGVPWSSPFVKHAQKHGVPVETDIGLFLDKIRPLTKNIFGITGTKGKSTTATLFYRIIKAKYPDAFLSGNITGSVFDIIGKIKRDSRVILELSSFQLSGIANKGYSPRIGIFTNFMEDHLNYYNSMQDYFRDKSVIYRFQEKGDVLVVNREDPVYKHVHPSKGVTLVTFGQNKDFKGPGSFIEKGGIYYKNKGKSVRICDVGCVRIPGTHNLYNVLAAVAASCGEGLSPEQIAFQVSSFNGIEHRLEYVGNRGGVVFYNDTAATTPQAAIRGVQSFQGNLTLIAGGSDKNLDLDDFVEIINGRVNRLILLEGNGTDRLLRCKLRKEYTLYDKLENAVADAFNGTKSPGIVLLSPGFASFGMFQNEFHRGKEFKRLVFNIVGKGKGYDKR
jgi:UDP-N-acetylmuramoylalanine--D-glutamate ligase